MAMDNSNANECFREIVPNADLMNSIKEEPHPDPSPMDYIAVSSGLVQQGLKREFDDSNEIRVALFTANAALMALKAKICQSQTARVKVDIAVRHIENIRLQAKSPQELQKAIIALSNERNEKRRFYRTIEKSLKSDPIYMNQVASSELKPYAKELASLRSQILKSTSRVITALSHNLALLKKEQIELNKNRSLLAQDSKQNIQQEKN